MDSTIYPQSKSYTPVDRSSNTHTFELMYYVYNPVKWYCFKSALLTPWSWQCGMITLNSVTGNFYNINMVGIMRACNASPHYNINFLLWECDITAREMSHLYMKEMSVSVSACNNCLNQPLSVLQQFANLSTNITLERHLSMVLSVPVTLKKTSRCIYAISFKYEKEISLWINKLKVIAVKHINCFKAKSHFGFCQLSLGKI